MSLYQRLHPEEDRRQEQLPVIVDRRQTPERRQPRWIERMQRQGLPDKDMTREAA